MFIELAEFLRCPEAHEAESYCVLVPTEVVDRDVRSGFVGCPVCEREYPIVDGIAHFETPPDTTSKHPPADPGSVPAADVMQALVGLSGPGGYVVLVGSAALAAASLGPLLGDVRIVSVNSPSAPPVPGTSVLQADGRIPLKSSMARGVVVGADCATGQWLGESVRVLLRGLRLVVLTAEPPLDGIGGVEPMATGGGIWVGVRR
jgi:uncharacterized protein YbaR (Trm112 family)